MEKYSGGGRGSAKDRGFWLQSFNGGPYTVNRVGRGASVIPNLSVSLLGGIQPEPIRAIASDMHDDGLLQRLFPIILSAGKLGRDEPMPDVVGKYAALIGRLTMLRKPVRGGVFEGNVRFSPGAQRVWQEVAEYNHDLASSWEFVNVKLAAHCGKYNGMFSRLCLLWHCIESDGDRPAPVIEEQLAVRVRDFMYDFLYPHAISFYTDVIGLSDRQDALLATAGWILTHRPIEVTVRDVMRGDRVMRKLDNAAAEAVLERLDAFGWLNPYPSIIRRDSKKWIVDPGVYAHFEARAIEEQERRASTRALITSAMG